MKKVLIVSRRYIRKDKLINWVSEVYLELLAKEDLMPLIVPIAKNTLDILQEYLNDYNALLMIEGGDIDPDYYNESYDIEQLEEYDPLKDQIEITCCLHAMKTEKPILGLCRGMQMINVLYGGNLHHDVHKINKNSLLHIDYNHYDSHRHKIKLIENTPLWEWYGKMQELSVNSYHHQGIKKLAPTLSPMAIAEDGLIEAIYDPNRTFVVGIQFHPERMLDAYKGNMRVFEKFAKAVKDTN